MLLAIVHCAAMKRNQPDLVVLPPPEPELDLPEASGPRLDLRDEAFDRMYPVLIRDLSAIHWTPFRVARRAAELLDLPASSRVLDVGSGVGKFCLVASKHSPATFVGMERRRNLVELAEAARAEMGAERVAFLHADALLADWTGFDAVYFYNPFGEHFLDEIERIDSERYGMGEYSRAVRAAYDHLEGMPAGTRVALYHGFGTAMPAGYQPVHRELCGTGTLELWQKGL